MKMFTKLALVSSLAISANAMAMQSMDDAALSAATGQDGINIGIALGSGGITIDKLYLHEALLHKDFKCKAALIEPNLRRNLGKWST